MLTRNDQPLGLSLDFANASNIDFAKNNVFVSQNNIPASSTPSGNDFLLLDGSNFLLLDGTNFLLL